ncbi:MAG: hypothetical protein JNN17_13190 [Verrucomicrobiaceae bacterium]|nr:hypothetical protein [Verrucomicrobiaceae bacterium]
MSEEQEKTLNLLVQLATKFHGELAGQEAVFRQADALLLFDTRGQQPDLKKLTDQQLRDMFDAGRSREDINKMPERHKLSPTMLAERDIRSDRGPESKRANKALDQPEVIVPASREYLENAVGEWMKSINYDPNPRDMIMNAARLCEGVELDLEKKIEALEINYKALQKSVLDQSGEPFRNSGVEDIIRDLKSQKTAFKQRARDFVIEHSNSAARLGVEYAAKHGITADDVSNEIELAGRFDSESIKDLTGCNIQGLDLSKSDLSRTKIDALTLSLAEGLDSVQGVDPKVLVSAQTMKKHTERLADVTRRLEMLNDKSGVVANLRNIRHGGVDGERKHLLKEIDKANGALLQTRARLISERQAQIEVEAPANEFEPRTTYQFGGGIARRQGEAKDPRLEALQASETFKVDAEVALNEQGTQLAFAKTQIGSKSERMKKEGAAEHQVIHTRELEASSLNNLAALFGTAQAVDAAETFKKKEAALGSPISSMLTRSVATSVVDETLGMNIMAKEKFGVMQDGQVVGISVGVPGSAILVRPGNIEEYESFLDIDYKEPALQKGFYDLQAQDFITGQIDRHSGNIFVDPHTGQVSGIDNDMAFPTIDREQMVGSNGLNAKAVSGMPQFLHSETADKIEALDPEDLRIALQSIQSPDGVAPLEPAAIDGAVQRLKDLQAEIKVMRKEGRVVSTFNDDTFRLAMERQQAVGMDALSPRTSYLATAVLEQNKSLGMGNKRIPIKKNDVPEQRPRGAELTAYQAMVADARNQFAANPEQIQDAGLAAVISTGQGRVAQLQNQLNELDRNMAESLKQLNEARGAGQRKVIAGLEKELDKTQQARQETLQKLRSEQQNVSRALDVVVAPLKPTFATQARIGNPKVQVEQPQNQVKAGGSQAEIGVQGNTNEAQQAEVATRQQFVLDLLQSTAESNKVKLETLNILEGEQIKDPDRLRRNARNNRADAGASRLAGDQMAGAVEREKLSESDALAVEGTLEQLGEGSELEVNKMYARGNELEALAEVQDRFAEVSEVIMKGGQPTQEQLEGFGAAVQAYSECSAKALETTQAVSASIEQRIKTGLQRAVGPLLEEKGYTPAEEAATIAAITAVAMDVDIMKLRDTDERADLYVSEMVEGIKNSNFDYPGGNKVHAAVYQAFDAAAVRMPDESLVIKPAGGGQTFNEKRANEHIEKALADHQLPAGEPLLGQDRSAALVAQLENGQKRMAAYESKIAAHAAQKNELHDLNKHLEALEAKKEHLQNNASKGEKIKAILKNGLNGTSAEIKKIDQQIAATRDAIEAVQAGMNIDQQKAGLRDLGREARQAGREVKKLEKAEQIIAKASYKGALDDMGIAGLTDSERDALIQKANKAINVREALKPQEQQLRQKSEELKADEKKASKAVSVRERMRPQGAPAAGGHRGGHSV